MTDVPPARELLAYRHDKIGALIESHVGAELQVAINLLTLLGEPSDDLFVARFWA